MEIALVALGLGACYFLVSVGLDKNKTLLQRWLSFAVGVVAVGFVVGGLWF
jgi:hypothetical protein